MRLRQVLPYIPPGANILDIGCDDGALLKQLPAFKSYVGLDRAESVIELDRQRFRQDSITFIHADFADFSWTGPPFDVVVLSAVLEHLEGLDPALDRLRSMVADGGRLVATTPAPISHNIMRAGAVIRLFARDSLSEHKNYFRRRDFLFRPEWELDVYRRFELGLNQLLVLRKRSAQKAGK